MRRREALGDVHAGARFTVGGAGRDRAGRGPLPAGRAENAEPSIDWGVTRFPTVRYEVDHRGLPEHAGYRLTPGAGLTRRRSQHGEPDEPVVVVVEQPRGPTTYRARPGIPEERNDGADDDLLRDWRGAMAA